MVIRLDARLPRPQPRRFHCRFAAVIFGVCCLGAARAATLKGIVLSNELGGPPIAGVEISADGANPTQTKSNGAFLLDFPRKKPGDPVRVIAQKPGLMVVNDIQLDLALPGEADTKPLIILMSQEGSREEMARRFYRLKSFETVDETYQTKLKELERLQNATASEVAHLRQERDEAQQAAERLASELAKQDPRLAPELFRQAMRLFLDGKVDQALKVLDEARLQQLVRAAQNRRAEADRAIEECAKSYVLRGNLLATRFQFKEAEAAYHAAADAVPDNFRANIALAEFQLEMKEYSEATARYQKCQALAKTPDQVANVLNNLGLLYHRLNRLDEARTAFEKALLIRRGLARGNPDALPEVALTLNNLGNLKRDLDQMADAGAAYGEALEIYREFADKDAEAYAPYVASTLENLANYHAAQNRATQARTEYEEALEIHRRLARRNPEVYGPEVAHLLNNLGVLLSDEHWDDQARMIFDDEVTVYRGLSQKNPDTYRPLLAAGLINLGAVLIDQKRLSEARRAFEEALQIRRGLADKYPDVYMSDLALILHDLGGLDADEGRHDDARADYEESLRIRRALAAQQRPNALSDEALTLTALGDLAMDQDRLDDARAAYGEALDVYGKFVNQPDPPLADMADTFRKAGVLLVALKQLDGARSAFEQALEIDRQLARRNPDAHQPEVALILSDLGELCSDRQNEKEARQFFEEALEIYRDLARRNPKRFTADVERLTARMAKVR